MLDTHPSPATARAYPALPLSQRAAMAMEASYYGLEAARTGNHQFAFQCAHALRRMGASDNSDTLRRYVAGSRRAIGRALVARHGGTLLVLS